MHAAWQRPSVSFRRPGAGPSQLAADVVREGVGCESCHGPAAQWIEPHRTDSWKRLSEQAKAAKGMTPTRSLPSRASLCTGCHVGGLAGDVNHDLIAAGHPRLSFELTTYLEAIPAHWDTLAERRDRPSFEAEAWAFGQVATVQDALGLLVRRANAAKGAVQAGLWPEFAEYSCSSCHHEISAELPPSPSHPVSGGQTAGNPRWGTWSFSMARALDMPKQNDHDDPLETLVRLMNDLDARPDEAVRLALAAQAMFSERIAQPGPTIGFDREKVLVLLARASDPKALTPDAGWDRNAQVMLALRSLGDALEALGSPPNVEMTTALDEMKRLVDSGRPGTVRGPSLPAASRAFEQALRRYHNALLVIMNR